MPFLVEGGSGNIPTSESFGGSLFEGGLSLDINRGQLYIANSGV